MENTNNKKSTKKQKLGLLALVATPLALVGGATAVVVANQPQVEATSPVSAIPAPVSSNHELAKEINLVTTHMSVEFAQLEYVDFGDNNLYTTRKYGQSFYAEKASEGKYRVFTYFDSESVYLSADSGFPIIDVNGPRIGEAEFAHPTEAIINAVIDRFFNLFAPGTTYAIYDKTGNGIKEYVTSQNDMLKFENTHTGSPVKLTQNHMMPLTEETRSKRSVSGRAAGSGNLAQDRAFVRNSRQFRKRKINIHNPKYKRHVYALKIKGTKYFMEQTLADGYRIFIHTDEGLKYLDPKTGMVVDNLEKAHFDQGSVHKMYQIAKLHRDNK